MPTVETDAGRVTVTTDHPGGNGDLLGVDGDAIRLRPEIRDSSERWFYWHVALEPAFDGRLCVAFDDEFVSPRGPAVRRPQEPWSWLGADARESATAFAYDATAGERVQFALAPAYQVADFDAFLDGTDGVERESLTTSEDGRAVPLVRTGRGEDHVFLTARHHACESTASYVLEGFLAACAAGDALDGVTVHAVPFVDVDGVERGDQGKNRAPHDHNRDYVDGNALTDDVGPIYRSTRAVTEYVNGLATTGSLHATLDFHCPYKWGGDNDRPFFVEPAEDTPADVAALADALAERSAGDDLSFDPTPGVGIHQFDGQSERLLHTFSRFAEQAGADLATTFEVPYVGTEADPVTPHAARTLGRRLAAALDAQLAVE